MYMGLNWKQFCHIVWHKLQLGMSLHRWTGNLWLQKQSCWLIITHCFKRTLFSVALRHVYRLMHAASSFWYVTSLTPSSTVAHCLYVPVQTMNFNHFDLYFFIYRFHSHQCRVGMLVLQNCRHCLLVLPRFLFDFSLAQCFSPSVFPLLIPSDIPYL